LDGIGSPSAAPYVGSFFRAVRAAPLVTAVLLYTPKYTPLEDETLNSPRPYKLAIDGQPFSMRYASGAVSSESGRG
jgi:hypothetical protein